MSAARRLIRYVRKARKQRELSQAELARMLGVSQSSVAHLEGGTRPFTLRWWARYKEAGFNIPDDLVYEYGTERAAKAKAKGKV